MSEVSKWLNIILVGSNPIPCYVQAAHLMDKESWSDEEKECLFVPTSHLLVYTKETEVYKKALMAALKSEFESCEVEAVCLQNSEAGRGGAVSQYTVEESIKKNLDIERPEGVILNNTGGTKVMTTYATVAMREWCRKNQKKGVECYLSEQKLNCYFSDASYKEFMVSNVSLTVKEMVELHGMALEEKLSEDELVKKLLEDESFCKQIKSVAARLLSASSGDTFCQEYLSLKTFLTDICNSEYAAYFKSVTYKDDTEACDFIVPAADKGERFKQYTDLLGKYNRKNKWLCYDEEEGFTLEKTSGDGGEMADLLNQVREKGLDCWKLFMEDWFYYYICCAVKEVFQERLKFGGDIMYRPWIQDANGGERFDILVSEGYQLIVFAITGEEKSGSVKMDFFETLYQSEKIGGSQSKVVLISRFTNGKQKSYETEIEEFRKDMDSFITKQYHQAEIFGREEVENFDELTEKIRQTLPVPPDAEKRGLG